MTDTLAEIFVANKFFFYVMWTSFMLERTLGLYLLTAGFWLSKKERGSLFYRSAIPVLYFLILNAVMIYHRISNDTIEKDFSYFLWFCFICLLTYGVYKFVDKFQGRANKKKKRVRKVASA